MAKKEATTAAQFELLALEMEKHPDVAAGAYGCGSSKARVERVWYNTSKLLNEIGPPFRTPSKWRKIWTDYRGRLRKKLTSNNSDCYVLSPIEQIIDSMVVNTTHDPSKPLIVSSPTAEAAVGLSFEDYKYPQISCSPQVQESLTEGENEIHDYRSPVEGKFFSKKQIVNLKRRRQNAKNEDRRKLIKLTEKQTKEMAKITVALGKLTSAIEAQNKILQEKFK